MLSWLPHRSWERGGPRRMAAKISEALVVVIEVAIDASE
jgi:hypothetical protein